MNYQKLYNSIVANPDTSGYTEKHHIVPRSLGGSDDNLNLVEVSARQHFLLHWLLVKIHTGENRKKMIHAFMCMKASRSNQQRVTSRIFEYYRKEYAESLVGRKRKAFSKEWRQKLSEAKQGENNHRYGVKVSAETKQKQRKKALGRTHSDEVKSKIGAARLGKKQPKKLCPHCDKEVAANGYARWHGENCKYKA